MHFKSSKKFTLLERLSALYPDSSKTTLRSWIDLGRIYHKGTPLKNAKTLVDSDSELELKAKAKFVRKGLKILFEDEHLVVIDKPAGLLSVAADKDPSPSAHELLKRRYNKRRVYPIHRLDRETEGLLVFAYTVEAKEHLRKQLEARTMQREYRALVHGHPGSGIWRCFLKEERDLTMSVCTSKEGREAITHFETLEKRGAYAFLKLNLETGRKHQIRLQASHAGYPIKGDKKYGLEGEKAKRLRLEAVSLQFIHPKTGKRLQFTRAS